MAEAFHSQWRRVRRDDLRIAELEERIADVVAAEASGFWRWLEDGLEAAKAAAPDSN